MNEIIYTDEQLAVFDCVKDTNKNILIEALAGASKTFTAIEATKFIPEDKSITFLAFNKHIKDELVQRLPKHIKCFTSHGIGLNALLRKYGKDIKFDEFKVDKIIKDKSRNWNLDAIFDGNYEKISQYFLEIKNLVNLCRTTLTFKKEGISYLIDRHGLKLNNDKDIKNVLKVMEVLMNDRKTYDYTDMIFLPAIDKNIYLIPQDYVIFDEVQDSSMCQQRIVEKMLKRDKVTGKVIGRFIVIGDRNQNIYSFLGCSDKSFDWFKNFPNTELLTLTYTFRCAKKIVEHAQKIVPNLKATENAIDGCVRDGNVLTEPQDGDFVLCRTTMPLVKLFFHFLTKGKKATIKGSDVGGSLLEMTKSFNDLKSLTEYWNNELLKFQSHIRNLGVLNCKEHSGYVALEDKVLTLIFLCKLSQNIDDLKAKIKALFTEEIQGIVLSTVHKSKGLEANKVFIVRPDLLPMKVGSAWEYQQEKNLEYVAITRAKNELIYDFNWKD